MKNTKINIPNFFYKDKIVKVKNPLFVLKNISKYYGKNKLFSDVNLVINSNDRLTIVGPNGTGKSSLLKIMIGQEDADDGNIDRNRDLRIGYLPQETHWKSLDNTVAQEMRSVELKDEADRHRYKGLSEMLLKSFGFLKESWERKIKTLSGGQRTKLALAKILAYKPNMLVLDEPTNHLDLETIEWMEAFLADWQQAIVCVSHDRYFLDKICNKTFELSKTGLEKYYCSYSGYLEEKDARAEQKEKSYDQQQKYLKKQQVFIDRFRAKATKARAVQSRIKQLDKIERIEIEDKSKNIKIRFDAEPKTCTQVLEIRDLAVGRKESPLFSAPDTLTVNWGDKIGIIGNNGMGKSTLLKVILGKQQSVKGSIDINPKINIGYYAQSHEELDPEKTILDEVSSKTVYGEERTRSVLASLLFTKNEISKKIECLSGGERARVALAEIILQRSNFLLLDEPTNHLDLPSKEIVGDILKNFNGAILLVSHDRYILNKVCTIIWEVKDWKLTKYLGNYSDYRYKVG